MSKPNFSDSSSSVAAMPKVGTLRGSSPIGRMRMPSRVLLSMTKTRWPEKRKANLLRTVLASWLSSKASFSPSNHSMPRGTLSSWYFCLVSKSYVDKRGKLKTREKCVSLSSVRSPVNSTCLLSRGLKSSTRGRAASSPPPPPPVSSSGASIASPSISSSVPCSRPKSLGLRPPKVAPKSAWPRSWRATARKRGYQVSSPFEPRKKPTIAVSNADVTRSSMPLSSTSLTTGRRCL
mmetsp:Transcript_83730/g.211092  ORF Transcript_83730/g.211092 Transcript_83730/m.211092 type:complete len:235 (+) Transcript_83730:1127-1831(+)